MKLKFLLWLLVQVGKALRSEGHGITFFVHDVPAHCVPAGSVLDGNSFDVTVDGTSADIHFFHTGV